METIDIFQQICSGFKTVHAKNIIHRDIKPANFLIHNGVVKISDFGFARTVDTTEDPKLMTFLGSPLYMAPQILGKAKFSSKCDVWSLGITIFELLFGRTPFRASSPEQLLTKIKTTELVFPEERKISGEMEQLLRAMLTIEEEERISWNEIFKHPLISPPPPESLIDTSEDELHQSFINNQIYLSRNKVYGKISGIKSQPE